MFRKGSIFLVLVSIGLGAGSAVRKSTDPEFDSQHPCLSPGLRGQVWTRTHAHTHGDSTELSCWHVLEILGVRKHRQEEHTSLRFAWSHIEFLAAKATKQTPNGPHIK